MQAVRETKDFLSNIKRNLKGLPSMDLQFLFEEPIIKQVELDPGYDDHASYVWSVETKSEKVIVRSTRMDEAPNNDFWWGSQQLFGLDPRNVHGLELVNNTLDKLSSISVPRVIRKGTKYNKQFVVMEKIAGEVCRSFIDQPASLIESLGEGLAKIHQHKEHYIGLASGTFKISIEDFHTRLAEVMSELVDRYHFNNVKIREALPNIVSLLKELPVPEHTTFVLVDMDPTQFLSNGKVITGLVDTEAYVLAPSELDFIALEYVMDDKTFTQFATAYSKISPLPQLDKYRLPYRYFYRLIGVQGSVDLDEWLNQPALF